MSSQLPATSKGRKAAKYRGAECLNCGTPLDLSDVYCSYCGQLNTTKSLSLKDFFGEFIGSIITYDSRFRYTVKDLLFRPGVITRNYVQGQRLKYANPFRFFLSVSIIFFLIQGLITTFGSEDSVFGSGDSEGKEFTIERDGNNFNFVPVDVAEVKVDSVLAANGVVLDSSLQKEIKSNTEKLDSIIKANKAKKNDTVEKKIYYTEAELDSMNWANRTVERFTMYYKFYQETDIKNPGKALDSLGHENSKYNRWAYQKNRAFEQIQENPADFLGYLMSKVPFFVFFFTPLYAMFFWLIYSKKKYTYMEHMIFIFHIFSFVFLALLVSMIPDQIMGTDILSGLLFGIIGPFYFYKALRNFYKENRLITIVKFIFLNFVFFVSANIAAILFFAVTAAMY
ncbi:MAG: DUF3667 domain-containing protein [Bacteroidota bacterium]